MLFFPFWDMEKAEKILSEQERNGYRFVKSRFCYLFTFKECTSKKVQYVFSYTFPKDFWPVLEWENLLKSDEYRAKSVQQGRFTIFRITKENVNLQEFYLDRLRYVLRVLKKKAALSIFFIFVGIFTIEIGRLFSIFVSVGALLALLNYIIGFFSVITKIKSINKIE